MGSYREHQNILKKFKVEACKVFPRMRFFDRHVGLFFTVNNVPVKINQKGMADMYAIYPTKNGLMHIEIEVKSGNARQSKTQKSWQNFIESQKGIYILVREVNNGIKELEKKIGESY